MSIKLAKTIPAAAIVRLPVAIVFGAGVLGTLSALAIADKVSA